MFTLSVSYLLYLYLCNNIGSIFLAESGERQRSCARETLHSSVSAASAGLAASSYDILHTYRTIAGKRVGRFCPQLMVLERKRGNTVEARSSAQRENSPGKKLTCVPLICYRTSTKHWCSLYKCQQNEQLVTFYAQHLAVTQISSCQNDFSASLRHF